MPIRARAARSANVWVHRSNGKREDVRYGDRTSARGVSRGGLGFTALELDTAAVSET